MKKLFVFLFITLFISSLQAATVIDIKARGMQTRLMMDDNYARVDNAADGSYLLLDRKTEQSYLVLPSSKQIMKMRADGADDRASRLKVELIPQNSTRQVMGYVAQHYRLLVNKRSCGDVFASTDAMQSLKVQPMLNAVATLVDQQLKAMGAYVFVVDSCTQASMTILSSADAIGLPLRLYDAEGRLLSDIVNIDTEAELEAGVLSLPTSYAMVNSSKELSPLKQVVKNARQYSPQVDAVYQQVERFADRYRGYWQR